MWHGYAVTSSTLLADPPSNETIDVFYIKTFLAHIEALEMPINPVGEVWTVSAGVSDHTGTLCGI